MEKKLMERIDKAVAILNNNIKAFYEEKENFFTDAFRNKDVLKMINTITDTDRRGYSYRLNSCYLTIREDGYIAIRYQPMCDATAKTSFSIDTINSIKYTDSFIDNLKRRTEQLNESQKWFKRVVEQTPAIIEDITTKYKNITEKQSDTLDEIFTMLDVEEEPTKHIKVTVEWI